MLSSFIIMTKMTISTGFLADILLFFSVCSFFSANLPCYNPVDFVFSKALFHYRRLFLLQGGLCQFEWRTIELWNKVVSLLSKAAVVQQYANLRDRMAMCVYCSIVRLYSGIRASVQSFSNVFLS